MKEEAGTGCNAARHSHKRAKRGPPLTIEDKKDLAQQGHSAATDATYQYFSQPTLPSFTRGVAGCDVRESCSAL